MMKFLSAVFVCFVFMGQAQFNAGARLGGQLATVATNRPLEKPTMRIVPSGGLLLKYDWRGGLGFQTELNFVAKGYKSNKETLRSNYIELPLLVRLDVPLPLGDNYKAYGVFGPYFGAGLGRNFKFNDTLTEVRVKEAYQGARVLEYGWQMGAGFMYPFKVGHFFGEFRYSFAMSNITKGYSLDRNRTFGLFVGYIIPLSALKIAKEVTTPDKLMVIPDAE